MRRDFLPGWLQHANSTPPAPQAASDGEKWLEGEAYRIAGKIELKALERDTARAKGYFERATETARAQQTRSWELRAATSLAHLWRDQSRRIEAHDLLAPIFGWFTEGFDTLDLVEAKVLLAELAS
jgi:predicted ATPase